jgi:DNA-binding NtrC family response regulator
MNMHFPSVPVEAVPSQANLDDRTRFRPLALVVDDEPMITQTLAAILNCSGLAALTAPNGEEALATAIVIPPEILITDMNMPGMNGLELASEITRRYPDCEVILFSGQAATLDLTLQLRNSEFNFVTLVKPVHPVDLLDRVFERLNYRGASPRQARKPRASFYDSLSSVRSDSGEVVPLSWDVSAQRRVRTPPIA